jgi:hypothetical protein
MKIRVFLAVVIGYIVSRILLAENGLIGLLHDWSIPPFASQITVLAREIFDGWHYSGLGSPVVYPSEYPVRFLLEALTFIGIQPAAISKAVLFCIPALSFLGMSALATRFGLLPPASLIAGGFYALSPVLFNKLVSGQLSYLVGYALLPLSLLACARAFDKGRFRDILVLAMMLTLTMAQIQLGVVAVAFIIMYVILLVDVPYLERFRTLGIAFILLAAAESPTVIGTLMNGRNLQQQLQFEPNMDWLHANSIYTQDAVRFLGYVTKYFDTSVRDIGIGWQVASWVILAFVVVGIAVMPLRIRLWCSISGIATILFVGGSKGVFAEAVTWFFLHIGIAQMFRELYHVMAALAIVYALALGYFFAYLKRKRLAIVSCSVFAVVYAIYLCPMLSGNLDGWIQAAPVAEDLRSAYDRFGASRYRVAWFPIDQPVSFNGNGAGVDPLAITPAGSLWQYSLSWPLTALDLSVRDGNAKAAGEELEALSVGTAVFRKHFASELPRFLSFDPLGWHFFSMQKSLDVAVGTKIYSNDAYVAYAQAHPLPHAFATDAIAYVPARLDVIAQALHAGYVPLTYGTQVPRDIRYAMFVDNDDFAAEATNAYGDLNISDVPSFDARKDFVPLSSWYFYRPAYADSKIGLLSFGRHTCRFTVMANEKSGVIIIAWIATPIGGRVRVSVGKTTREFSTKAPFVAWRSVAIDVGSLASGETIRVAAIDADAEVALRAVRVLSHDDFRLATQRFTMQRNAAQTIVLSNVFSPFQLLATGRERLLPEMHSGLNFRLTVRGCASKPGLLEIEDVNSFVLAQAWHGSGCFTERLGFDGSYGSWGLFAPGVTGTAWTLEERARGGEVPALKRYRISPATFMKNEAGYQGDRRIFILNETFNSSWISNIEDAQHIPTALGTNAWVTPAKSKGPVSVRYGLSRIFHAAYAIGLVVICAGFLALL